MPPHPAWAVSGHCCDTPVHARESLEGIRLAPRSSAERPTLLVSRPCWVCVPVWLPKCWLLPGLWAAGPPVPPLPPRMAQAGGHAGAARRACFWLRPRCGQYSQPHAPPPPPQLGRRENTRHSCAKVAAGRRQLMGALNYQDQGRPLCSWTALGAGVGVCKCVLGPLSKAACFCCVIWKLGLLRAWAVVVGTQHAASQLRFCPHALGDLGRPSSLCGAPLLLGLK